MVRSIEGAARPESVVIEDVTTGKQEFLPAEGVFIRLGVTPNTELVSEQLDLDESGYIIANSNQQT